MADKPTGPAKTKPQSAGKSNDERSGRYEPRPIGELAGRLVAKPLGKRGFAAAALVADWATIVGPNLAASTLPLRVVFPRGERVKGILHLKVASGALALQMQHLGPLIIERVNGHFGYRAVAQLALVQGPVPARTVRPASAPKPDGTAEVDPALAGMIASLPDEELKKALASLGRRLAEAWQGS